MGLEKETVSDGSSEGYEYRHAVARNVDPALNRHQYGSTLSHGFTCQADGEGGGCHRGIEAPGSATIQVFAVRIGAFVAPYLASVVTSVPEAGQALIGEFMTE